MTHNQSKEIDLEMAEMMVLADKCLKRAIKNMLHTLKV